MAATGPSGDRRSWWRSLLGMWAAGALLAVGAGAWLAGTAWLQAGGDRVGSNAAVSAGADDPTQITAYNSPSLARSPVAADHLAVASRVDSPTFSCALHISDDAGASWQEADLPFPEGEETDPERCYAPDVAFGGDGRLHVTFATLQGIGNTPSAVWHVASDDVGSTFTEPVRITGDLAFQVRLAVDPVDADRLYAVWLDVNEVSTTGFAQAGNPIVASRSGDGGASWGEPVVVNDVDRDRVLAPAPAVGADGQLYVAYVDVGDGRLDYHGGHELRGGPAYPGPWSLVVAASDDAGDTWAETLVDDALVPFSRIVAFLPDFPSVAVDDDTGRVYVAFHDARRGDADVWLWASDDVAAGFGPPTRVNDTPIGAGTSQHLPAVAVAPDGRVDIVYYDRRSDPEDVDTEVSLQSSWDGGATFGARTVLSDEAFDSQVGFGSERGLADLGSRLALVSTDQAALAIWADTRVGTQASNKQVLAHGVARIDRAALPGAPARLAGAVAALVGLVWLVASIAATVARRRNRGSDSSGVADLAGPPAQAACSEGTRPVGEASPADDAAPHR